jgi:hypothetical protein
MHVKLIKRHILHLEFDTQYDLTSTFLRFQEHYESPRFRGKIFTLEQFMDWYAKQKGKFSYYEDWHGFNLPSSAFVPFRKGLFNPLLEKEQRLLALLGKEKGQFYVIATFKDDDPDTLDHELCHALFFLDDGYRKSVQKILKGKDVSAVHGYLKMKGYHRAVWTDEVNAYLTADMKWLKKKGVKVGHLASIHIKLKALFDERWEVW